MDQAIEEEDYETAASIRDQVKKLTDLEQVQVAEANQRFYDAFESGSTAEMARVWGRLMELPLAREKAWCCSFGFICVLRTS